MVRRTPDKDRSTVARHATLPSPGPARGFLKIAGITLGVVLVSAIAVAAFVVTDYFNRFNEGAVTLEDAPEVEPPSISAFPGEFSVLLIGTDECGEVSTGLLGERCSEADGGILNDVNLLVHVSAEPRKVTVISFPRDLMLETPECTLPDGSVASATRKTQINSIFQRAGISCVAKTVTDLTGVEIPFAAKIDFDGVIDVTDAIGGVEVCIGGEGIRDEQTAIDWGPGPRTVSGYEALQFIRTRHGVGDESDMARVSNQQQYMSRLVKKIMSDEVLSDPGKVLGLANTVVDNIDPSDKLANPVRLAQLALSVKDVPFSEFVFLQYPVFADPDDSDRVIPNRDAAATIWDALKAGQPVQLTGDVSNNGGVELVEPAPGTEAEIPATDPSTDTPATDASGTEAPAPRATLDSAISGQTAEQETCANGRQR
ncbi:MULTISPECIES: LCP family protein [Microbacterium]|uniref:LCP family protein n=1 Tax=Microbacterium maritypicum TaxID=33918 RepID=A0AAJ5VCR9_MICMQ|nr:MULTISPECIES: LCP family protein [Microbacterium]EYT58161.1 transcriptional regulator [Microbacterium sp. UCD-TDU]WEF21846.1 LCP family protein [Microbacterium liquefaciens]